MKCLQIPVDTTLICKKIVHLFFLSFQIQESNTSRKGHTFISTFWTYICFFIVTWITSFHWKLISKKHKMCLCQGKSTKTCFKTLVFQIQQTYQHINIMKTGLVLQFEHYHYEANLLKYYRHTVPEIKIWIYCSESNS